MPDLVPQSPLMQAVSWQGQEYFASQYFHRQYIANSLHGGKYQRHGDFLRVVRSIPAYAMYLRQHDIVEISWDRIKTEGKHQVLSFQPLFKAAGWNPLTLLNATIQVELSHHLDDTISQQMAVASSTMIARQMTRKPGTALADETAVRIAEAWKKLGQLFGTPEHIAQQEAVKQIEARTGLDLRPLLLAAPAQTNIAADDKMLEPTELAKTLGLPSAIALNRHLESLGWQVARIGGGWEPTPTGAPQSAQHAWIRGAKSGYNIVWRIEAVRHALSTAGIIASQKEASHATS